MSYTFNIFYFLVLITNFLKTGLNFLMVREFEGSSVFKLALMSLYNRCQGEMLFLASVLIIYPLSQFGLNVTLSAKIIN